MKQYLKTAGYILAHCLFWTSRLFGNRTPRVYILMYHSVEDTPWKYGVSPIVLERQLAYVRKRFHVVPLSDVVAHARGERILPDRSIAVTFDDGYKGVYEHVLFYAKAHAIPFTVFLTTDLREMEGLGNLPRVTWEEVRSMVESGIVSVEAHGHSHRNLAALSSDLDEVADDIRTCIELIALKTGRRPRYFAYPSGHKNEKVIGIVSSLFEGACSITEGTVKKGDDPFLLKRIQIDRTMSYLQFRLRIGGGIDIHHSLVRALRSILPL